MLWGNISHLNTNKYSNCISRTAVSCKWKTARLSETMASVWYFCKISLGALTSIYFYYWQDTNRLWCKQLPNIIRKPVSVSSNTRLNLLKKLVDMSNSCMVEGMGAINCSKGINSRQKCHEQVLLLRLNSER